MDTKPLHQTHGDVAKRLKRAEGHLRNVIQMIETGRACLDIAQQLHAVEKAIEAAKTVIHQPFRPPPHSSEDVRP